MKWANKFINYILFFSFCICIGIFSYVYFLKSNQNISKAEVESLKKIPDATVSPEDLVNKYMKQGALALQKQKFNSVNKINSKVIDADLVKNQIKEVDPSKIPIELQIKKNDPVSDRGQNLTDEFNIKAYKAQIKSATDSQAKIEYAKQFIENARKDGYHITLSEDLQVTSVTPIRKPTNQSSDEDTFESDPSN